MIRENLVVLIITWSIVGFPLVAACVTLVGLPTTQLSYMFRLIILVSAIIIVLTTSKIRVNLLFIFILVFWISYTLRLIFTYLFDLEDLYHPIYFYFSFGVGACLIPAISIYFSQIHLNPKLLVKTLFLVSTIVVIIALFIGEREYKNEFGQVLDNRLSFESLNPISLGHVALSQIITSYFLYKDSSKKLYKLIILTFLVSGVWCLILCNSRGPIVVLLGIYVINLLVNNSNVFTLLKKIFYIFLATGMVVIILPEVSELERIYSRLLIINTVDATQLGRVISFVGAWEQFLASPIFGSGVEEKVTGLYPHNTILEALMSTGVIGGIPYFLVVLFLLIRHRLYRGDAFKFCIFLLCQQYVLGSMLSGALYSSTALWATIAIVISPAFISGEKLLNKDRSRYVF